MKSLIVSKQFYFQTRVVKNKYKRLTIKNALNEGGEYNRELYIKAYKTHLNNTFQEHIIKPIMFEIQIKENWCNVCDVSLSLGLKDNQYYLDINLREDIAKEKKNEIYDETTLNESIAEVLFQLNKWRVGQYTINVISEYTTLMEFDKNKSVSIPLSIYASRLEEFDL